MLFIDSSVTEINSNDNPFSLIEMCGRTCYKSENKITPDSSLKFVSNLIKNKHFAMTEHKVFTFMLFSSNNWKGKSLSEIETYLKGVYTYPCHVTVRSIKNKQIEGMSTTRVIVSVNLRALNELINSIVSYRYFAPLLKEVCDRYGDTCNFFDIPLNYNYDDGFKIKAILVEKGIESDYIENVQIGELFAHKFFTFKIICDRGVSHEIVRHRLASYAQESTRYVNYGKQEDILFIRPSKWDSFSDKTKEDITYCLTNCEKHYMNLIHDGVSPQLARSILPNALKTEIIMTANLEEFIHFIKLRYLNKTGKAHPDMIVVAKQIFDIITAKYEVVANLLNN